MRFLVLGCNGMAGHMISCYMAERGHDVTGFARTKSKYVKTIVGDARNEELVRNAIVDGKYDYVINSIGILNAFAEENKNVAVYLNSYLPHYLADITQDMETSIIHMSTDCVFSGERGAYTENDLKDGTTFYDRTKALGELDDDKNLTLRNSIVGPDIDVNGIGLLNWFMRQEDSVNGFTKAIWTGQTTLQLAKTMEKAAMENATGLYNMVPDTSINKYDLLVLFNHYLRNDSLKVTPVDGIKLDKSLVRTKFEFDYQIPDYEKMICEMAQWMREHKTMYPHYKL